MTLSYGPEGRRIFSDKVEKDLLQLNTPITYQPDPLDYHAFRRENLHIILQG